MRLMRRLICVWTKQSVRLPHILREYDEAELIRIFRDFGEEKLAPRYARAIVGERRERPIIRSEHLVRILNDATPYALKNAGHPAKRVFQALRIEVNGELSILRPRNRQRSVCSRCRRSPSCVVLSLPRRSHRQSCVRGSQYL